MSALDELLDEYGRADTAPLGTLADLRQKLQAHRAEALAENLTGPERQFLTFALDLAADRMASRSDEFTDEDEAALTSLRAMASAPVVPAATTGGETEPAVEFGVRHPDGHVLTPTPVRADAERHLARFRAMYPTAVLVQRTFGLWTEVPR